MELLRNALAAPAWAVQIKKSTATRRQRLTFQWFLEGGPVTLVLDSSFHSSVTIRRMLVALTGDVSPSTSADGLSASPGLPPSFFLGGDVPAGTSVGRSTAGT
jgi:hypothetical protein